MTGGNNLTVKNFAESIKITYFALCFEKDTEINNKRVYTKCLRFVKLPGNKHWLAITYLTLRDVPREDSMSIFLQKSSIG